MGWFYFFPPIILYYVCAWCCSSFSLCYLFLHFFKGDVELVNLADLIQLSSHLSHSRHIWGSFLQCTSPKLDKLFHFWYLSFMCILSFLRFKKSLLVLLEPDIVLLPSLFFFTFCQPFFVPPLVQLLLSGISQIIISCIFIDRDCLFLDDLLFFLSCFFPLSPSIQLIARFCYNMAQLVDFLL